MVTSCSQGDCAIEGISLTNHETRGGRSVLPTAIRAYAGASRSSTEPSAARANFENAELPKLFGEVPAGVYRVLFLTALKTGIRLGELSALTWGDVDLVEATIRVRRSYTGGELSTPKNHKQRSVDLTAELVELLDGWWGELGGPDDSTLVFPGETGYLNPTTVLRRELYPAMKRAGIPARRADRGEADVPLVPAHAREGGARDGPAVDLAEPASRALVVECDVGRVRPLRRQGAEGRGGADGGRLRCLSGRCEDGCAYRLGSTGRSLWQFVTTANAAVCRRFPLVAVRRG